jgi:hypothetical protein
MDSSSSVRKAAIISAFHFVLLSYPLHSLLWRRSYPIISTETGIMFAVLIAFSILLGLIFLKIRPLICFLLSSIIIVLTLMIQYNLFLEGVLITLAVSGLLMFLMKDKFYTYSVPIIFALVLGAYLDSLDNSGQIRSSDQIVDVNKELPPVVHIMLDGIIGPGGLPDYPASDIIKAEMLSFFEKYDFELFPNAYSRYVTTGDSLYSAMNFVHSGSSSFGLEVRNRQKHVMKSNAMFDVMDNLGYRLNVFQTRHIDMCRSNTDRLDRCWQYNHPNLNSMLGKAPLQIRVHALRKTLLRQSRILRTLLKNHLWMGEPAIAVHDPAVFTALEQDIKSKGNGNYFYAHALLPHGPYTYQSDCSVTYDTPISMRVPHIRTEPIQTDLVYETRNGLYFGQIECALRSVAKILDAMKEIDLYDQAIVVVHGDHGSLISPQRPYAQNVANITNANYRAFFSTLFTVRYPSSRYTINDSAVPLSYLLEKFNLHLSNMKDTDKNNASFASSLNSDDENTEPFVYLIGTYPLFRVDVDIFQD